MSTRQELAQRLLGNSRAETAQTIVEGQTLTYTTTAASDSVEGMVSVNPFGEFISDDEAPFIELPTTTQITAGEEVFVTLYGDTVGKHMLVTGVAGKGDAMAESISNIQVGGTNLLVKSNMIATWIDPSTGQPDNPSAAQSTYGNNSDASTRYPIAVLGDTDYTLTLYDARPDAGSQTGRLAWFDSSNNLIEVSQDYGWTVPTSQVFHSPATAAYVYVGIIAYPKYRWKFERGNRATDYSPAPEDTEDELAKINNFVEPANQWMTFQSEGGNEYSGLVIGNDVDDTNTHIVSGRIELNAGGQTRLAAGTEGLSTNKIVMGNSSGRFIWYFDEQSGSVYLKRVV